MRFIAGEGFDPHDETTVANSYTTTTALDLTASNARVDTTREVFFVFPGTRTFSEIARGPLGAVDGIEHAFGFPTGAMTADRAAAFQKQLRITQPLILARAIAADATLASDGGNVLRGRLLHHVIVVDAAVNDDVAPIAIEVEAQTGEIARIATLEND